MRTGFPLDDMRLADVTTFLTVCRCGSVTGAARALQVTPSQVSKVLSRLEALLGVRLMTRSARGAQVSEAGRRLLPQLEDIVDRVRRLTPGEAPEPRQLVLAAPSYLSRVLLPRIAVGLPQLRLCGVELPPALVRTYAAENIFDVALSLGRERLPRGWAVTPIGQSRLALLAAPALATQLGPQPVAAARLREVPFITPVYHAGGQFVPVDDACPLAFSERRHGHEVPNILLALELAAATGQLVYGPLIAAQSQLAAGTLVEVRVDGWDAREQLFVACNEERVLARTQRELVEVLRRALAEIDSANPPAKGSLRDELQATAAEAPTRARGPRRSR